MDNNAYGNPYQNGASSTLKNPKLSVGGGDKNSRSLLALNA